MKAGAATHVHGLQPRDHLPGKKGIRGIEDLIANLTNNQAARWLIKRVTCVKDDVQ